MDIVIHSLGMPFNGETISKQSLGGSESAAYYQARELARRGHHVTVFTTTNEPGEWDGVGYHNVGNVTQETPLGAAFTFYAEHTPHDVLIIQRHPAAFHRQWASKINLWQMHDLALHRSAGMSNFGMWQVDYVTAVSEFHKRQIIEVYGFDPDFVAVVPNGVDADLYSPSAPADWTGKEPLRQALDRVLSNPDHFNMLYQSRPERGLEHLLRPGGIMSRLVDTRAKLLYCAYSNTVPQMAGYYAQLDAWAAELPNVVNLGALTKAQLAQVQRECSLLIYPTEFEEVSCITAMEAMHAGLPLLTSACAALPETCEGSGTMLVDLKDGKADEDGFVSKVKGILAYCGTELFPLKVLQYEARKTRTWGAAVDRLEATIDAAFARRLGSDARNLRHCIEHSDVMAARIVRAGVDPGDDQIVARAMDELDKLYGFADSEKAYKEHYDVHQSRYYDAHEDKVIGEDVTHSTRFRGVMSFISQEATRNPYFRMLDYGCAHGHYLIPIAKANPQAQFVGLDVSPRAIKAALTWVQKENLTNIELMVGNQSSLDDLDAMCPRTPLPDGSVVHVAFDDDGVPTGTDTRERQLFDVILAGEVLEHVPDPLALLEQFRNLLKPDGIIIASTPCGRWEWTGRAEFRKAREHLWHFERQDIREICGENDVKAAYAPAGPDITGRSLGSWVWCVRPRKPFGQIDQERKLAQLAPRETVSACMIVRNGENTLRKCLLSFIEWVDEVVIAIDPTTTDQTRRVISEVAAEFPWTTVRAIDGVEALKDGFAAARNRSIETASGDWILWVDADEEVSQPWQMWKYLRPSQHRAYGFKQVHYSARPAQVLTEDLPCRLFRRRPETKFHGLVHEHPEEKQGESIKYSMIRTDMEFLHNGYVDEETRRARFRRNLPLLMRDIAENPDRKLNKFLYLRDIAQGLAFEHEQTGGVVLESQPERAVKGIEIWGAMLKDESQAIRMLVDSLPYYTQCVATTGKGFDAEVSVSAGVEAAPDLTARVNVKARFYSKEHFFKLTERVQQEATRHYESRYL